MITRGAARRNMQEEMWETGDIREKVSKMEELRRVGGECRDTPPRKPVPQENSEIVDNRLVYDALKQMVDQLTVMSERLNEVEQR